MLFRLSFYFKTKVISWSSCLTIFYSDAKLKLTASAIRKACDFKNSYVSHSCSTIAILLLIDSSNLSRLLYVSSASSKCFRSLKVGLGLVWEVGEKTKVAPKLLLSALSGEVYSILNKVSKLKLNTIIKVLIRHPPIFIAIKFTEHLHRNVSVKLFWHGFIKELVEVLNCEVTFAIAAHQFP